MFTPDDVNPFMSAEEQEKLRQAVRETNHKGVFTPSSHLRHHIQFPGAWGGANWGSVAADPGTGMLFVRSLEMPSYRRMALSTERQGPPPIKGGQREQDGYARVRADLRRLSRPRSGADANAGEARRGWLPPA